MNKLTSIRVTIPTYMRTNIRLAATTMSPTARTYKTIIIGIRKILMIMFSRQLSEQHMYSLRIPFLHH